MSYNGATATWSGYNHQGKVGLFVALREMARLLREAGSTNGDIASAVFADWCLEFEGAEDFDICEVPLGDGVGEIYSRHQVKAYAGNDAKSFQKYKQVLNPYSKKVKYEDGSEFTKQFDGFKKRVIDLQGNDLGKEIPSTHRFLHTIQAVDDWSSSDNKNENQVGLYHYPGESGEQQPYCDLSRTYESESSIMQCPLFKMVVAEIQAIDPSNYPDERVVSRVVTIWQQLQACLHNIVAAAHVTKARARFSFTQIYQIIVDGGGVEDWNRDRIKRKLQYEWERIQKIREANSEEFDENYGRAKDWIEDLLLKDNDKFDAAIGRLRPHKQDAPDLDVDENGFRYVVHDVIRCVKQYLPKQEGSHYNHNGNRYYLTTISEESNGNENKVIARDVLKGINEKTDDYFRQGKIITRHLSIDYEQLAREDEFSGLGSLAGFEVGKFTEMAPKSLITAAVAIDELNRKT